MAQPSRIFGRRSLRLWNGREDHAVAGIAMQSAGAVSRLRRRLKPAQET